MKILVLAMKFLPASGGTATYAYNMAMGLHRSGHYIKLLAPGYSHRDMDDSAFPFHVTRMKFVKKNDSDNWRILFVPAQILIAYFKFKPDVIWATGFAGAGVLALMTFLKAKFIATIHGGSIHRRYPSKKRINRLVDRLALRFMRRAEALVTVSESSKKLMERKIPDPEILKKVSVIYNGLDFDESAFLTRDEAVRLMPQLKDRRIILTVSRLIRAKGQDIVIQAVAALKKKFPNILYVIVGEGEERENLEQMVRSEGVNQNVIFAGYANPVALEAYYALCDVFIMTGRETPGFLEGFGLVYIEAGIRGKPVIGTRVGGIPEAIADNKTGFIIEPEDRAALVEKITQLLDNAQLRKKMANQGAIHVRDNFSIEVMTQANSKLVRGLF